MRSSRIIRNEQGAAAVEFALVLPVLLLIVFGIIDFGRVFWVKNNLVAAMREGARTAAAGFTNAADPSDGEAKQRVVDYIKGTIGPTYKKGNATATSTIEVGDVSVAKNATTGYVTVKLAAGYTYQPITPFAAKLGLGNVILRDSATFRWEQAPTP